MDRPPTLEETRAWRPLSITVPAWILIGYTLWPAALGIAWLALILSHPSLSGIMVSFSAELFAIAILLALALIMSWIPVRAAKRALFRGSWIAWATFLATHLALAVSGGWFAATASPWWIALPAGVVAGLSAVAAVLLLLPEPRAWMREMRIARRAQREGAAGSDSADGEI